MGLRNETISLGLRTSILWQKLNYRLPSNGSNSNKLHIDALETVREAMLRF